MTCNASIHVNNQEGHRLSNQIKRGSHNIIYEEGKKYKTRYDPTQEAGSQEFNDIEIWRSYSSADDFVIEN